MLFRIIISVIVFLVIVVLVNAPRARGINGILHPELMISFPLTSAKDYAERGAKRLLIGYNDGALEDFGEAIKRAPTNADYYCMRAILYNKLGKASEALVDCAQVISLDKRNDRAYWVRATIHLDRQNYVSAMKDLDRAIEINPHSARAYSLYAKVYSALNQPDNAINMLNKSLAVEKNPDAYLEMGRINFERNRYDEAAVDAEKAKELYGKKDDLAGQAQAKVILDVVRKNRDQQSAWRGNPQKMLQEQKDKFNVRNNQEERIHQLLEQAEQSLKRGDLQHAASLRNQANDLIRQLD